MWKLSFADNTAPECSPTLPSLCSGHTCSPNTAPTSALSNRPASITSFAPFTFSSAGWNSSATSPDKSSLILFSSIAAPRSPVMWISCAQACITPRKRELSGALVASSIGSASISQRNTTALHDLISGLARITPTTPVSRLRSSSCIPNACNTFFMYSVVLCSARLNSGSLCNLERKQPFKIEPQNCMLRPVRLGKLLAALGAPSTRVLE